MHFLCLHGAIGNSENIKIQLAPLQKHLEKDNPVTLHYINGPVKVTPPSGFEQYFGVGPHYRWSDDGGAAEDSLIDRVRNNTDGTNAEDMMRGIAGDNHGVCRNYTELMQYFDETLDKNPEIAGIIGYSEGASLAATYLLEEQRRQREEGRPRRLKCGIFITGWPAMTPDKGFILADEDDEEVELIDVPTLHVVGAKDPFRHGSDALYNICDPDSAVFFDMGKGHLIPRAGLVVDELCNAITDLIESACSEEN